MSCRHPELRVLEFHAWLVTICAICRDALLRQCMHPVSESDEPGERLTCAACDAGGT